MPRYLNSPDINTEDFSSAVDFLSLQEYIDPNKILEFVDLVDFH